MIKTQERLDMKGPSKRQKRTGLIATARKSLCHDRSVYNTLVLILISQECDIIAHAKKKGKSKNIVPDLALTEHHS